MTIKNAILDALDKKYDAEIASADATIKIYLENLLVLENILNILKKLTN